MDECTRPPAGRGCGSQSVAPITSIWVYGPRICDGRVLPSAFVSMWFRWVTAFIFDDDNNNKLAAAGGVWIGPGDRAQITLDSDFAALKKVLSVMSPISTDFRGTMDNLGEQNLNVFSIYSKFLTRFIATTLIDMLSPQPLLIHLTSSFLISTLRLTVEPDSNALDDPFRIQIPFVLVSPHSNISFSLWDNGTRLVADNLPVGDVKGGQKFRISARCQHAMAFRIRLEGTNMERMIASPDFCTPFGMSQLLIGPDDREDELFYGCIRNVSFGSTPLSDSWCRYKNRADQSGISTRSVPLEPHPDGTLQQLIYTGDKIQVPEGGSAPINWKHLYLFPDRQRYGVRDEDVNFEVVDGPEHGALYRVDSLPTASPAQVQSDRAAMKSLVSVAKFTYADISSQSLEYRHDGSETSEDSFDVVIDAPAEVRDKFRMSNVYTVSIIVEPKDDPPQLFIGPRGPIINLAPGARFFF
ncbi:cadherin-like domain-containing protein [Ditylenchus destructor]|uniref:Cadherin-like domain-containing protein n=1 Tax=Ditylenchus destructor TaxID=166010 RepID=A0AAD4MLE4_9BILA|nr:cadherin-like domain-containing protein [Ditylenchus destructor]